MRFAARWMLGLGLAGLGWTAQAAVPQRILLIPIDDRPAVVQFPQMIGNMAATSVETPPAELLGRFTQPGKPEMILAWMRTQNLRDYDAIVVSMDMIAYGGLIASRVDRSSYNLAINRLRDFWAIRNTAPETEVYGFSSIMRVAPTATLTNSDWRDILAKYAEEKADYGDRPNATQRARLADLARRIPNEEVARYERTRDRNKRVNEELIRMAAQKVFTHLTLGEDDSKPTGPQKPERERYQQMVTNLGIPGQVLMCAGIDQLANLLVSRAIGDAINWRPRLRIVYADEAGRLKIASYESQPIEESLRSQINVSGARIVGEGQDFDYSLFINTPDASAFALDAFLGSLKAEVDQGFPVAVADTNLGRGGIADPRLFEVVTEQGRSARLLAYAGWNTAGNTMGTTIPAANTYLMARRERVDPLRREIALRTFVLHRLVNDFEYHNFVRPEAYAMMDQLNAGRREEAYGEPFNEINERVRDDLGLRLQNRFESQLKGTRFFAGNSQYEVVDLRDVQIALPWPRAYEVQLDFSLVVRPVLSPYTPLPEQELGEVSPPAELTP
ncbi:MAG: DUF4127 family protein [Fimbriimonadaceae bacterium]|nr:DUF4127 family protein [Fimbriimonadaceae bacterium]